MELRKRAAEEVGRERMERARRRSGAHVARVGVPNVYK
jgi:hypothetical protein